MKQYKCKKELMIDLYDEDGFSVDGEYKVIEVGEVYETYEDYNDRLLIANKPAIHLVRVHDKISGWIEIYPETLAEYFEEMTEGENG